MAKARDYQRENELYKSKHEQIKLRVARNKARREAIKAGRVEKGDNSDTRVKNVNMDFSLYSTHLVTWRILPNSNRPVETSELRNYCPGCGVRIKKSTWKFCPSCGNEL
jgi:rRNA maturation endonuclease Nob1